MPSVNQSLSVHPPRYSTFFIEIIFEELFIVSPRFSWAQFFCDKQNNSPSSERFRQPKRTERIQKTEKDEVLRRIPIADVHYCAELNSLYKNQYNKYRPHQALEGRTPENRVSPKTPVLSENKIIKIGEVNGLITRFVLEAA